MLKFIILIGVSESEYADNHKIYFSLSLILSNNCNFMITSVIKDHQCFCNQIYDYQLDMHSFYLYKKNK